MNKFVPLLIIIIVFGIIVSPAYSQTIICYDQTVFRVWQLNPVLECFEDRIVTLESSSGGESTTASNLGTVGEGVFAQEVSDDLQFKKLVNGTGITLSTNGTRIMINSTASGGENTICSNVGTGNPIHKTGTNCSAFSLIAGTGITIINTTDDYTIDSTVVDTDTDKQIAQVAGQTYQSILKQNLPTTYADIYTTLFEEENQMIIDCANVTYSKVVYIWDFVGADNDQLRWINVANNTQVFYESPTFTTDRDAIDSGFFIKPSWCVGTVTIEWQGKSSNGTNDPVAKGYKIVIK